MKRKYTRTPETKSPGFVSTALNYTSIFVLAGVFILGIGIGIAFSTTTTLSPGNVVSREFIDQTAPNPELCVQYGASAMELDTRLFVSLNPFNVYVAQPSLRPGCVLRTSNWDLLVQRRLVTSDQVRDCKQRMNTFAFTGDLGSSPEISCVYQNDAAKNFYLNQPGAVVPQETQRF
ncbi:hypothetical protein Glo7428_2325 [Gloeocapsa sp. PCC 7428]|uniref:DUF3172 domain-containing protein n=1 Tax=Gloeocapsa sp. PCC 7428 TaxID=1173026 RepID=UPI0002A5CB4F|nr:DUF3172 domain-containing protein [Gloeocapsa sp. PCC 7428]AFZ30837.1 hypothetical protein Glo7428_2325 [Gloeocapsa sp. PCC 7428]